MVMPLIGVMDAARAEQVLESVLNGARVRGAEIVIIDITGMQQVSSYAAGSLIKTADALRLLGVQTVVTGVRPEVAQILVRLGIDMGALTTRRTLKDAIADALESTWRRAQRGTRSGSACRAPHGSHRL
jgi:anti-anti-sigma factor